MTLIRDSVLLLLKLRQREKAEVLEWTNELDKERQKCQAEVLEIRHRYAEALRKLRARRWAKEDD